MSFKLVDFHCHLDLYPDIEAAIAAAEMAKLYTLTVTTTPRAWPRNRVLTEGTRYVQSALGLHPQLILERVDELKLWEKYLDETRYIGEVGLDAGPRYYKSFELQKRVFKRILSCCAESGGKILSIHSIRSATPVLDLIEEYLPHDRGRVVLHWFTGSLTEARRAVELGCFFSINAKMVDSNNGENLVNALPLERILTETDSPFTNQNNNPISSKDVYRAITAIAAVRSLNTKEVESAVQKNLRQLLIYNS